VRRVALAAFVFLVFAPVARAGCGLTSTPVIGSAPLAVTFTATCESAGYWRPALTSGSTVSVYV
jgi:hypothetical protein